MKLFLTVLASVAITFICLFIKPTHVDPRFGLPLGAFFAVVGNNIFVGSVLPGSERFSLADMMNVLGIFTIFLVLAQSAISLHLLDTLGRENLSLFFDRVSFAVFFICYVAVTVALPLAAVDLI